MNPFSTSRLWLTALSISALGCGGAIVSDPTPDAYWAGRGYGVCTIAHAVEATEAPRYDCPKCRDKGWLPITDTGGKRDCPDCDLDPPLDNVRNEAPSAAAPREPAEKAIGGSAPEGLPAEETEESVWFDDYDAAMQAAAVTGRKTLVLFCPTWECEPCKNLKNQLEPYLDGEGHADWVGVVKIVSDAWAKENALDGFPGYAMLDPDGQIDGDDIKPKVLTSGNKKSAAEIVRLLKEFR